MKALLKCPSARWWKGGEGCQESTPLFSLIVSTQQYAARHDGVTTKSWIEYRFSRMICIFNQTILPWRTCFFQRTWDQKSPPVFAPIPIDSIRRLYRMMTFKGPRSLCTLGLHSPDIVFRKLFESSISSRWATSAISVIAYQMAWIISDLLSPGSFDAAW